MSNADNVVINVRERPLSTDINDAQSMLSRSHAEALRWLLSERSASATTPKSCVLGGLEVAPSASNVLVQPGMLAQFSATLPPTPGTLDSAYRIGRNVDPTVVVMPSPGSTTYYVLEAQVTQDITVSAVRDVLDPGTGTFQPALLTKQVEYRLTFRLVAGSAGGSVPLPSGGDWVPLAVVRRPGGGGAVAATDIVQIGPLWGDAGRGAPELDSGGEFSVTTYGVPCRVTMRRPPSMDGVERYFISPSFDISTSTFRSPATTLAADTWYYVYLVPWAGLSPVGAYGTTAESRGLLVLSHIAPTLTSLGVREPSSALGLPAPWNLSVPPTGDCLCIGAVLRNTGNTDWVDQTTQGTGDYYLDPQTVFQGAPSVDGGGAYRQALSVGTPATARAANLDAFVYTGTAGHVTADLGPGNNFDVPPSVLVGAFSLDAPSGYLAPLGQAWVPSVLIGGLNIRGFNNTASNLATIRVRLIGFRW